MTFDEAARVLGVKLDGLTENEIRSAFNRAVRLAHPDTGGGSYSAAENIARAKKARDALLRLTEANGAVDTKCTVCKGSGVVPGSFANATCKKCKGTGVAT